MAIVKKNGLKSDTATVTTATAMTLTMPPGITNGDYMLLSVVKRSATNSGESISGLTGWSLISATVGSNPQTDNTCTIRVYQKTASSEPGSYSLTWATASEMVAFVQTYSGVDTVTAVPLYYAQSLSGTNYRYDTPAVAYGANSTVISVHGEYSVYNGRVMSDLNGHFTPLVLHNGHPIDSPTQGAGLVVCDSNGPLAANTSQIRSTGGSPSATFSDAAAALIVLSPTINQAISVARNEILENPGFDISLTGINDLNTLTITRVPDSGNYAEVPVRGLESVNTTGLTVLSGSDYESSIFEDYTYTLYGTVTGQTTPYISTYHITGYPSVTTPVPSYAAYVKDPLNPNFNRPIVVADFTVTNREGRELVKAEVLGRANPVVLKDVLSGRTGTFTFYTFMDDSSTLTIDEATALLETGNILMFSSSYDHSGEKDFYFSVNSVEKTRITPAIGNILPCHEWAVSWTEVDRPADLTDPLSSMIWSDVASTYPTWADVATANATWGDLLT